MKRSSLLKERVNFFHKSYRIASWYRVTPFYAELNFNLESEVSKLREDLSKKSSEVEELRASLDEARYNVSNIEEKQSA